MTGPAHAYGRDLSPEEIGRGEHRAQVGGLWEQMGRHQLDFLIAEGLRPDMKVLDVGCGCLRAGVHLVRYLEPGNYYGIDVNASLLQAGYDVELRAAGLQERLPRANLLHDGEFEAWRLGVQFDVALAQSLFTHLPANLIRRCLHELARCVRPDGALYATFFEAPADAPIALRVEHQPGGIVSYLDRDPYHYRLRDILWLAAELPWRVENLGDWGHPRGQRMLRGTRAV